jgi:hypothetical protein
LATPAVVEVIPVRQAWRAATLGNMSPPAGSAACAGCRSKFAGLLIMDHRPILLDSQ